MMKQTFVSLLLLVVGGGLVTGCEQPSATPEPDARPSVTDTAYLRADHWNDGQAEVAFYRVERTRDQYGRERDQQFTVGTYLVKHRFSPAEMTKKTDGTGASAFKYALFYELESGSYQYKRNWVVNARQKDLRPYKQSFTSFDWCSNQYRELSFPPDGDVEVRLRSDDYGNRRATFEHEPQSYPPAQIPVLVRGLDLSAADTLAVHVVQADSSAHVPTRAVGTGLDSVSTPAGTYQARRIEIHYERPVSSPIGEKSARMETYWVGTGPQRRLLRMEAASGRYEMALVEHLRSPYWTENVWSRLDRVKERP
ncbi:MAG: hypothetical protein BRD55_06575 [Bacteroidetes bacterium SW_9_63_38]|nr:MAG: hypothetical protein BRD55_06575 [Bacteroidetes bacterium SW_9_63_38]